MTEIYGFMPTEKMLDPIGLAEMLGISVRHLADVRAEEETFPEPKMLGKLPRWAPSAIRRWMDDCGPCRVCGTGDTATDPAPSAPAPAPAKGKKGKGAQRVH